MAAVLDSFLLIVAADLTARLFLRSPKARWFLVHGIVNVSIATLAYPSAAAGAAGCAAKPADRQPALLAVLVHVYHVLAYNITPDDWFHHLLFVPVLGIPTLMYNLSSCADMVLFYGCGLPGAIMYAVLVVRSEPSFGRLGVVARFFEPGISAFLYTVVRMPFLLRAAAALPVAAENWFAATIFKYLVKANAIMYGIQFFWRFLKHTILIGLLRSPIHTMTDA